MGLITSCTARAPPRSLDTFLSSLLSIALILKYQLVIFDSDGTLADTLPWMRSVFNELADVHGFRRVADEEHDQFRDLHGLAMLKALGLPLWKLPRVVSDMRRRMAQHTGQLSPYPGIIDMLQRLHAAGVQLGVVSSNSRPNVERILGPAATALIRHYSCGASMFGKAGKIRAVVKASGVASAGAIYVGDEVRDAEAARKAGIAFGAVTWGMHSEQALRAEHPAEFFTRVQAIASTILG